MLNPSHRVLELQSAVRSKIPATSHSLIATVGRGHYVEWRSLRRWLLAISMHLPFPSVQLWGNLALPFRSITWELPGVREVPKISAPAEISAHPAWTGRSSPNYSNRVLAWTQFLARRSRLLGCGESRLQYCPTPSQQCTLNWSARLTLFQAIGNPGL